MPPVAVGSAAPDFSLAPAPGPDRVSRSDFEGTPLVILFFPLAFSGVCTQEMCRVADDWSAWGDVGAAVVGISVDSPFVTKKFAEETGVPFPILSDFNKEASAAYGVLYPEFFGMKGVSKRSAFVVDRDGRVAWAWVTEDADVMPPLDEILEVVRGLA